MHNIIPVQQQNVFEYPDTVSEETIIVPIFVDMFTVDLPASR